MGTAAIDIASALPATLTIPGMTEAEFLDLCGKFPDATLEYEADGTLLIMPPTDPETGSKAGEIYTELSLWNRRERLGVTTGPDTGFLFPDGSRRSLDAAWYNKARWDAARASGTRFPIFAPEFVIELRSPSDRLQALSDKMQEYIDNGVQLAWLIDPQNRTVTIYRPGQPPQTHQNPAEVHGEGPVEGFILPLDRVF